MTSSEKNEIISSDTNRQNRIPPGQHVVDSWPILHFDKVPKIDLKTWEFRAFGLVEEEMKWSWDEFTGLPSSIVRSDWHCVTSWSKLDMRWEGITSREIAGKLKILPDAKAVMVHSFDGYSTNLLLSDFLEEDVIFALAEGGKELPPEKGRPLRLVVPKLYAWKSAKWVSGIEFIAKNRPGFWELRGYHMHGDPWKEERYG